MLVGFPIVHIARQDYDGDVAYTYWHDIDDSYRTGQTRLRIKMPDGSWRHQFDNGYPLSFKATDAAYDSGYYWLTGEHMTAYNTLWYSAADVDLADGAELLGERSYDPGILPAHLPDQGLLAMYPWKISGPKYVANAYQGLPALHFGWNDTENVLGPDSVDIPGVAEMRLNLPASGFTIYTVCIEKQWTGTYQGKVWEMSGADNPGSGAVYCFTNEFYADLPGLPTYYFGYIYAEFAPSPLDQLIIHEWCLRNGALIYKRNGVVQTPIGDSDIDPMSQYATPMDFSYVNTWIGSNYFLGDDKWTALWFETRIYPLSTDDDLAPIRAELSATYGVSA